MQTDGKLLSSTHQQSSRSLRQSFSCLVDAMRFAYHKEQLEQKILEIEERSARSIFDLQELNGKLENLVQSVGDEFDREAISDLSTQITGFSHLAIEQAKTKIEMKNKVELSEFQSNLDSEITKTRKSIEAFIAISPFTTLDKVLNVKLLDGAYEARGIYRCSENIEYEFSYDTKKSRTFSKEFRLSTFEREFRVPISVGKTWLRRDQVPDYERIDQYALVSAESSETNLIVLFKHAEKDSQLKVVYSKHDSHSSLSIVYSDGQRSVDITSTPSLNRFLDSEPLERTMERVWLSIIDLENYKVGLTKLVSDEVSTLERLDCFEFFAKSWKIIAPRVTQEMKSSKDDASEDGLNVPFVLERVGMLGENADSILEILELKKI
jgi:hypothetical protein